ncbi:hypothetical protein QW180_05125 [Vibrio sinaloensis]|nr:hypothetical protein [Vibrio sinaloensis]
MKPLHFIVATSILSATSGAWASPNIQPDPQNPTGYVVSRADIQAAEQQKNGRPHVSNLVASPANGAKQRG